MFDAFKDLPVGWGELFKRTGKEAVDDDVSGLAAQLAYYFFLALFPALLFLVALASFFPLRNLMDEVVTALGRFAPGDVLTIITSQMQKISQSKNGGLLTLGFIGTLWSTSSAMTGIIDTLNHAYEISESRPWWKVRLVAIAMTLGVGLFILISFALVIVGPQLAQPLANWLHLGQAFAVTWKIVQWPLVFLLVVSGIGIIYRYGPDAEQEWVWITPGSLLATILWIVASLAFRVYVTSFGNYNATYGAIGGVIVALLWLYISGLAILVGAELNAEIEHASPHGKAPGERKPGERKKLGMLARRAWEAARGQGRQLSGGGSLPPRALVPAPSLAAMNAGPDAQPVTVPSGRPENRRQRRRASDRMRVSDWVLGAAAVAVEMGLAARAGIKQLRRLGGRTRA